MALEIESRWICTAASLVIWPSIKPYLMNTESIKNCDLLHMVAEFQLRYNERIEDLYMHPYGQVSAHI